MQADSQVREPFGGTEVPKRWALFCAIVQLFSMFMDAVLLTVIVPLSAQYKHRFGVSDAAIGLLFSSKAVVQVATSPFAAKAVDAIGCRVVMMGAMLVLVVSTAIYAVSGDAFGVAFAARAIQGIGSSGVLVGGQSAVIQLANGNEGSLLGIATLGAAAGVLLGPTVGGWLASPEVAGFGGVFWVLTVATAVVAAMQLVFLYCVLPNEALVKLRNAGAREEGDRIGLRVVLRSRKVWLILVGVFAVNFNIAMLEPIIPVRAVHQFDIASSATATLGLMWAAAPFGFVLFVAPSGILSDFVPKNMLMAFGPVVAAVGLILTAIASKESGGIPLFEVGLVLCGCGYALVDAPSQAALTELLGEQGQSAGFAALDMTMQLGFIFGPLIGGSFGINQHGFWPLLAVVAGLLVVCSAALLGARTGGPAMPSDAV
mmetsp:Transcript_31252/g.71329  ORF Transcript_31252/g.71329 Transcript_31252/m.71329 type:complete len:429 (+) Transcript_31252:83-1369(+)